jgi:hypothetical protein
MKIIVLTVFLQVAPTIAVGGSSFKGTVTDSSDTPISATMVLIHWDSAGSAVGLATNVDLPPGFYDVFAAAMAFSPTCRKIRVKQGEGVEVSLRMNADPLYAAEMGNWIEAVPRKN